MVLHIIRAPTQFIHLVSTMYKNVSAFWARNGELQFLFKVCCGVLQGCPLSAALFNFSTDPLLWMLADKVVVAGLGRF